MRGAGRYLFVALVFVPCAVSAQGGNPIGPEFRVNTYTTSFQRYPAVASDSSGNFVVVWESFIQDGSSGVFGQRYANTGAPLGPEFRVNTFTTGGQQSPAVASDSSGNFVVVWESFSQDGSSFGVFGQRYASTGAPLGPEFRVNTHTTESQRLPAVTSDPSGNFVVVWQSAPQDGSYFGVFAQRYASTGAPLGPEFRVNTYTTNQQLIPALASDSSGNFVVVWTSYTQDGSGYGVFGQRYASTGAPLGPEFRVNTHTTESQRLPAVTTDSSGSFVVVWHSLSQDGSLYGVFAQRYASTGAPLGPEFRVNTYTTSQQGDPAVASDPSGNFVVVWTGITQTDSGYGVFGQRYASTGAALGPEFRVNTYTTGEQVIPAVAADSSGNFVVVWEGTVQADDVFGQRYRAIVPVELMRFGVE
jgi:hypothetical protein